MLAKIVFKDTIIYPCLCSNGHQESLLTQLHYEKLKNNASFKNTNVGRAMNDNRFIIIHMPTNKSLSVIS